MRRVFRLPFGGAHIAREVDDELAFHLEMRTQRLDRRAACVPTRATAKRCASSATSSTVRQDCVTMDEQRERAMHRANVIDELVNRTSRTRCGRCAATPASPAIVVGALALGIGANTAIFTLIDAVLVRQLPVSHPEQLVAIGNPTRVNRFVAGLAAHRPALVSALPGYSRSQPGLQRRARERAPGRLDVRIGAARGRSSSIRAAACVSAQLLLGARRSRRPRTRVRRHGRPRWSRPRRWS